MEIKQEDADRLKRWAAQALSVGVIGPHTASISSDELCHLHYLFQNLILAISIRYNSYWLGFPIVFCKINFHLHPSFCQIPVLCAYVHGRARLRYIFGSFSISLHKGSSFFSLFNRDTVLSLPRCPETFITI